MITKQNKKWTALLCTTALAAGMVSGCASGGKQEEKGAASVDASANEIYNLSMMTILYEPEPPKADNEILKGIEEFTRTKLDINWVPSSAYQDKLNVTIASNEMPKVMLITDPKNQAVSAAVKAGAFWELGPFLKEFPNLSKTEANRLLNSSFEGKTFGLYRHRAMTRSAVVFRKDWLDSVGLKEPKTVDDIYQIAKAFTQKDPDKNGKDDTFGFLDGGSLQSLEPLTVWLGGPYGWGMKDNKLQPSAFFTEGREALKLLRKMFAEKLIQADFATVKSNKYRDFVQQGKGGLYVGVGEDAVGHDPLLKIDPKAQIDFVGLLNTPAGKQAIPGLPGYTGMYLIPKSSVKTEAEVRKILRFFDKLGEKNMQNLLGWGTEGKHFKNEDGKPVVLDAKLVQTDLVAVRGLDVFNAIYATPGKKPALNEKIDKLGIENDKFAIPDLTFALNSAVRAEKGSDLDKIMKDAQIKYIMGALDDAGLDKEYDTWRKSGGDDLINDYTKQYNALQANQKK